jgi:hypothetical protein
MLSRSEGDRRGKNGLVCPEQKRVTQLSQRNFWALPFAVQRSLKGAYSAEAGMDKQLALLP